MRVLIAPDKFKGSLTNDEVIWAITEGIKEGMPNAQVSSQPLADGGEGSLGILEDRLDLKRVEVEVTDPLFRPVQAYYLSDNKSAFIEMATASGLLLLKAEERNPLHTTTFGTGELIRHALENGCTEVNLLIGGSATNDCGIGMARALGFAFLDEEGVDLKGVGSDLSKIQSIDLDFVIPQLSTAKFKVLTDVQNPLLGEFGAAAVYGAQKGASDESISILEAGAQNLVTILSNDMENAKGAGAAGGLGYGSLSFLGAELVSGIDYMLDLTGIYSLVASSDLVITGEGSVDEQSMQGKVIAGLKRVCDSHRKPLAIICGRSSFNEWDGIPIYQVMDITNDLTDAMTNTNQYVARLASDLITDFNSKSS